LSYLYESDYGLLAEEHFHGLVGLETKRAQRSDKLHLLLLMDLPGFEEKRKEDRVLRAVASVLFSSTREADAKGWHRCPAVLGVLFTDLITTGNSLHSSKDAIVNRLRANLAKTLAISDVERIGFSCETILSSADGVRRVPETVSL